MKKLICLTLTLSLILPVCAFAEYSDVAPDAAYAQSAQRLETYGIMCGVPGGEFSPQTFVTRAQMAKMAAVITGDEIPTSLGGLFSDTPNGAWYNGYVNAAAKRGIIYGYPDGTFLPDKTLSYAEAITVVLRLLGYSQSEIGNDYPSAYLRKASVLKLTEDIAYDAYAPITRADCAIIIDRALMCDNIDKRALIENLEYTLSDECVLIDTNAENSTLAADEVATSIGTYRFSGNIDAYKTMTVKLVLDRDKKIVAVFPIEKEKAVYALQSIVGNELSYAGGTLTLEYDSLIYYKGKAVTLSALSLDAGGTLTVYKSASGSYDYAVLYTYELSAPHVVYSENDKTVFSAAPSRVVRDGEEASMRDLQLYDVLYYDKASGTLYAYCEKKSGIFEEAFPSKADMTSITLSGVSYEIETQTAAAKLKSHEKNDYVTLLLGRNGKVADVLDGSAATADTKYGVILSADERVSDGTKKYYTTVLDASGNTMEYESGKSYKKYRGSVIEIKFTDALLTPDFVRTGASESISVADIPKGAKIIDVSFVPALSDDGSAIAKKTEASALNVSKLLPSRILFLAKDAQGEIDFLALDDMTLASYSFGVMSECKSLSGGATYKVDFGSGVETYNTTYSKKIAGGAAVMGQVVDGKLIEIDELNSLGVVGSISQAAKNSITVNRKSYALDKTTLFFIRDENYKFSPISFDDIDTSAMSVIDLCADGRTDTVRVVKLAK